VRNGRDLVDWEDEIVMRWSMIQIRPVSSCDNMHGRGGFGHTQSALVYSQEYEYNVLFLFRFLRQPAADTSPLPLEVPTSDDNVVFANG